MLLSNEWPAACDRCAQIAAYHYFRIFNSWVDAYEFPPAGADGSTSAPSLTGKPFNDACARAAKNHYKKTKTRALALFL